MSSALARGSGSILTKYVCTYVHTWWVTLRNVTRNLMSLRTIGIGHMWHIQICSTQIDVRMMVFFGDGDGGRGLQHSGAIAARILQTPNSFSYSKRNMCHARLTCTRIRHTRIVCALAHVFVGVPLTALTLVYITSSTLRRNCRSCNTIMSTLWLNI